MQLIDLKASKIPFVVMLVPLSLIALSAKPLLLSFVLYINLYILSVIDWQTMRLPNILTGLLMILGLAFTYFLQPWLLTDHAIGVAVGTLFPIVLNAVYRELRGRDGIGMGDAKLLAGAGAWIGWFGLPHVLLIGSVTALIYAFAQMLIKKDVTLQSRIPFGPFLCMGIWGTWLFL